MSLDLCLIVGNLVSPLLAKKFTNDFENKNFEHPLSNNFLYCHHYNRNKDQRKSSGIEDNQNINRAQNEKDFQGIDHQNKRGVGSYKIKGCYLISLRVWANWFPAP